MSTKEAEEFTVHYDNGFKPVFEKFPSHEEAQRRVVELAWTQGRIAIILEDFNE